MAPREHAAHEGQDPYASHEETSKPNETTDLEALDAPRLTGRRRSGAGRRTVRNGETARHVRGVMKCGECGVRVCGDLDVRWHEPVARQDDGERGHRCAAGAADRALIAGSCLVLDSCSGRRPVRRVLVVNGLIVIGVSDPAVGFVRRRVLVHRTGPARPRAHRAERGAGALVAPLVPKGARRRVRIATVQRHQRRQRHDLEHEPGRDDKPKAPPERSHDPAQLNRWRGPARRRKGGADITSGAIVAGGTRKSRTRARPVRNNGMRAPRGPGSAPQPRRRPAPGCASRSVPVRSRSAAC